MADVQFTSIFLNMQQEQDYEEEWELNISDLNCEICHGDCHPHSVPCSSSSSLQIKLYNVSKA